MAENITAEQVRDEHLQVLGPTLGPIYHALSNEVSWLHAKWNQYRILFAESSERIELLNGVAGFFFRVIQDVLWDDVVLHIARLLDMRKDNLTLKRLEVAVEEKAPSLSPEIAQLVEHVRTEANFTKEWRNRRLAHRDFKLAVGDKATPLPEITLESVERALAAVRAVLNKIENYFWHSEVAFTHLIARGGADDLAFYLKVAIDSQSRERERVLQSLKRPK